MMTMTKNLNSKGEENVNSVVACPETIVALDCEMVGIGKTKSDSLARCSIVDYHGYILYDQYVKPKGKVTDYRTRWSGILPHHLDNSIPFEVARKQILLIIKNKVIVGHSLNFDFKILKIRRPIEQVRDTSKCLLLRTIAGLEKNQTPSLKRLTRAVLCRDIQYATHCSVEDSVAAMDLYRSVEKEWENQNDINVKSRYFDDSLWPEWLEKT